MKRKNSHGFLFRYQYPQKLVKWRDEICKQIPIQPEQDPLEPFMEVTEDVLPCATQEIICDCPFFPLVIGLWFMVYTFVGELGLNTASLIQERENC